ncbi:MAG: universal stress protein [Pyrinomonadaceae bacterium]|nr:universal stress protein [Pyrinomonadaceae bacterium]
MKLLISYDGSESSDKAIDDLQKAGLPEENVEAVVISVAEVWMPPPISSNGDGFHAEDYPDFINELSERRLKIAKGAVQEAAALSRHAKERILAKFPKWQVSAEAVDGSPAWEVVARAEKIKPDLIVAGSQGRNAVGRIFLGSISQKILTEANCSVRIARGKIDVDPQPFRIMIGFDGSVGSHFAVKEVASRNWGDNAEVCLFTAIHSFVPSTIGRFVPPVDSWVKEDFEKEKEWIEKMAESSTHELENAGFKVSLEVQEGNPKEILIAHAKKWQADSIFVGAHSYSAIEKFLIGSTAMAIAERAECSVEAVRSSEPVG